MACRLLVGKQLPELTLPYHQAHGSNIIYKIIIVYLLLDSSQSMKDLDHWR